MEDKVTNVNVYTDDEGHLHYDFVVDKRHMEALKARGYWTPQMETDWQGIKDMPEEEAFFKKIFTLSLLMQQLHNMFHAPDAEKEAK